MIAEAVLLLVSLLIILASCYFFVNAVERFGQAFALHQGIVGSILAAIGTALPETIIPIIAIAFAKGQGARDVGIGAIAGAPLMLSTLAFFVTGAAIMVYAARGKRTRRMNVDARVISKDLTFFLIIYGIAIATTLLHKIVWLKITIAVALLLSYFVYLRLVISDDGDMLENVEELYLTKYLGLPSSAPWISAQMIAALAIMIGGAHLFITHVQAMSNTIGVSPLVLSLIITPIATELPEKLNSVIWVGRGKETLAIGNLTGSMVFQSCFPVVFGMIFTQWNLRGLTVVCALLALAGAALNLLFLKVFKRMNPYVLMTGGALYMIFLWYVIH